MNPVLGTILASALLFGCASSAPEVRVAGDWCAEHGVPESECTICNPELAHPAPEPPPNADVRKISAAGEDVAALEPHAVPGKVTIFDFYADWCGPCRKIDAHVFTLLQTRDDLAVRKLNVVSWETPLAKRYLGKVPQLPYVVVFGRDGKRLAEISGFDLASLDRAIADGSGP